MALMACCRGESLANGPSVGATVWEHSRGQLVLGSSNGIRDVDLAGQPHTEPIATVYANRGLAGIDGTIATATGIALGSGRETTVLLGDVTFLHDAGGLLLGHGEPVPDLRIVVLNDSGGAIFSLLEHGGAVEDSGAYGTAVERLFGTPHSVDIAALAAAYGVGHQAVSTTAELAAALKSPLKGARHCGGARGPGGPPRAPCPDQGRHLGRSGPSPDNGLVSCDTQIRLRLQNPRTLRIQIHAARIRVSPVNLGVG